MIIYQVYTNPEYCASYDFLGSFSTVDLAQSYINKHMPGTITTTKLRAVDGQYIMVPYSYSKAIVEEYNLDPTECWTHSYELDPQ